MTTQNTNERIAEDIQTILSHTEEMGKNLRELRDLLAAPSKGRHTCQCQCRGLRNPGSDVTLMQLMGPQASDFEANRSVPTPVLK